jgi:small conductance mechanosensitive channel
MDLNQHSGFLLTYRQWIEIGIIVLFTFILTRILKILMNRFIKRSSTYLKVDKTRYKFFANATNAVIYIFAVIFIIHTIPALRSVSTTLFASAGILAAVIGFASQQAVSNIISGIFVVVFRPFRVGDNIKVGNDFSGVVEDITLRHTVIKDSENARIIIPNSMINSQTLINYDIIDHKFKKRISFNVSLDSDIDLASKIIQNQVYQHPLTLSSHYADASTVAVEVAAIGDNFVTLRTFVWTLNAGDAATLNTDINRIVFNEFKKNNIHFGEPQQTERKNG